MKPDLLTIVVAILIFAFCLAFSITRADAMTNISGACWSGSHISEQSSVACSTKRAPKYRGLYGFRHTQNFVNRLGSLKLKLSTHYRR